jgi:hypothetical protein
MKNFINFFTEFYLGDKIKDDETDGDCSANGKNEKFIQCFGRKTRR